MPRFLYQFKSENGYSAVFQGIRHVFSWAGVTLIAFHKLSLLSRSFSCQYKSSGFGSKLSATFPDFALALLVCKFLVCLAGLQFRKIS